jgi:hypothetical protein
MGWMWEVVQSIREILEGVVTTFGAAFWVLSCPSKIKVFAQGAQQFSGSACKPENKENGHGGYEVPCLSTGR